MKPTIGMLCMVYGAKCRIYRIYRFGTMEELRREVAEQCEEME